MTEVWRICAGQFATRGPTGAGARLYGGRWNPPRVAAVYTAASLSLAALELFVNLDPDILPPDLVSMAATIPEHLRIEDVALAELPTNWRGYPVPEALQVVGSNWVVEACSAVLSVPSAVIPHERNYILNPEHPGFSGIEVRKPRPFRFDPRMWT